SEQLLKWNDQQHDISQKVKELPLNSNLQNVLLKTYEIHKKDIFNGVTIAPINEKVDGEWEIYRDVINAATQGQFLLISEEEVNKYKKGIVLCESEIIGRKDIPICRNVAKERLEAHNFNKAKIMSWLLVLSEAITNIIKHAEQGKMTILESKESNEIRFVIEDKGPGFPLKELPKNTLLAGYSTKNSMGQGFTLMMKMAKQVLLFTTPKGSTLILTFDSREKAGVVNATY
ncbi:ATP-binding protein, partial [Bacillus sp. JJ1503]|uniref:ATP-binding protein n=1 Tax=Bacillus sp. JJ1503 TaxID=3122956 RepID=UPI0030009FEB